jgi:type IV pilus assembly protein PilN
MIRINLLPHRELKKAALKRQFFSMAVAAMVFGLAIWLFGHTFLANRIDTQKDRNAYLKAEIDKLDKQLDDIKKLREQIQSLMARKQIVEGLQSNRSVEVHLLDQLARLLPEGVYYTSIRQQGNDITLTGYAQSNARVSTLMRNLESSMWLKNPVLGEIKAATVNGLRVSAFTMKVSLAPPAPVDDGKGKGAKK